MSFTETKSKLESGSATIGIIGMGYVGVPLALSYTAKEINVIIPYMGYSSKDSNF